MNQSSNSNFSLAPLWVYPTDTVWGIGAPIDIENGALEVARIKKSDPTKPHTILYSSFQKFSEDFNFDMFPKSRDQFSLQEIFALEATIGIPLLWAKRDFPYSIHQGGEFICVRVLDWLEDKIPVQNFPIITTSLNITGQGPIIDEEEAYLFYTQMKMQTQHEAFFVKLHGLKLSGRPSTILVFKADHSLYVLREGHFKDKILSFYGL